MVQSYGSATRTCATASAPPATFEGDVEPASRGRRTAWPTFLHNPGVQGCLLSVTPHLPPWRGPVRNDSSTFVSPRPRWLSSMRGRNSRHQFRRGRRIRLSRRSQRCMGGERVLTRFGQISLRVRRLFKFVRILAMGLKYPLLAAIHFWLFFTL